MPSQERAVAKDISRFQFLYKIYSLHLYEPVCRLVASRTPITFDNYTIMKILIIEDEPSLREIMTRALREDGYVVECAPTYFEADAKIAGYSYDCILLDIMLPDGNGLKLLEQLKGKENVTKSGRKINVFANIGNVSDVGAVLKNDAGGIGLSIS